MAAADGAVAMAADKPASDAVAAAPPRTHVDETDELGQLNQLKADGVLDEQDFSLAKQRVLDSQRRAAMEAAGWVFSSAQPVERPTTLQTIGYTDLTQEVCASGLVAAKLFACGKKW